MDKPQKSLFIYVDCIELYTPDIKEGIEYYCNTLGMKVIWKTESSAGLGLSEGITEVVLQNERKELNVDFKVDSVVEAVKDIEKAGGQVIYGPFDIPIGKCAVVKDPWGNRYVIWTQRRYLYNR
jgi:predicted enzyme related to lactoylglutathione lyase